ncbi:MAG: hypothetical protein JW862_18685 [Anaerolineales bacterium]|nr:hypothetical protein [Anaerolineales bacterium]
MMRKMHRLGVYLLLFVLGGYGFWIVQQSDAAAHRSPHNPTLGSHALALTADGTTLAVANPDSNSVTLVNTSNLSVTAEITVGSEPRSVAILGRRAFVANQGSDSLTILDLDNPGISLHIPVGDRPVAVAISPDGRFLAVA